MKLLDRIRRLWKTSEPDHPLSDQERHENVPQSTFDSRVTLEQDYAGRDLDPDEPRSGRL